MENKENLQQKKQANKICLLVKNTDDSADKFSPADFKQLLSDILAEEHSNINHPVANGWTAMHFACILLAFTVKSRLFKFY